MKLYEEIYFEITLMGTKSDLSKMVNYIKSGELDEFIEISNDFIFYDDNYATAKPTSETKVTLSNDDYGIEMDEFDPDDFLEALCKVGKPLYIKGTFYDIDNEEYQFVSEEGNNYYVNARSIHFNEEVEEEF
jgi:S-adenosylmethionine:tRNA-ribosyltransferase-isomerase (queuine synthetase)